MTSGWTAVLNGTTLIGGDDAPSGIDAATVMGCLQVPPDGLGVPGLRVEDVIYPQRDGAKHFNDWYEPRIVTLADVMVCPDDCPKCPSARAKTQALSMAWSRYCDDTELVIFTDCHDPDAAVTGTDRALIGPYGIIGRPRVASKQWLQGKTGCASMLFRFDAVDHRMYVLDPSGEPGSGEQCVELTPAINASCRTYPRCYDSICSPGVSGMSYTESSAVTGTGPQTTDNYGTLCAQPTIVLTGSLTSPTVTNTTTGQSVTYTGVINPGDTITIDTDTGTAVDQDGIPRSYLLTGDTRLFLDAGENIIRLTSQGGGDTGTASVCYRPSVLEG